MTTLETVLKQTQEARVFRRAQAVREVVAGHHVNAVSAPCHLTHAALRTWGQRFAKEGPQGVLDRSRPGRPRQVPWALEPPLHRRVDPAPRAHGSLYAPWRCRALATVLAQPTGVPLGRERGRCRGKKTR